MKVFIAQLLCPERHAILGVAGESDEPLAAFQDWVAATLWRGFDESGFNPWCAICGAKRASWKAEVAWTRYASLAEAEPYLRACEKEQFATRAILDERKAAKN